MKNSPIGPAWDDAAAFLVREWRLLAPVALAIIGVGSAVIGLATPAEIRPNLVLAPWMAWILPAALLMLFGDVAVVALALRPGLSVREALGLGARRMPALIGLLVLQALLLFGAMLVLGVTFGMLGAGSGMAAPALASATAVALLPIVLVLYTRLALGTAAVVDGLGPVAAFRWSWRATGPMFWQLLAVVFVIGLGSLLLVNAVQFGLGSVFKLAGLALGDVRTGAVAAVVVTAAASTLARTVSVVYLARLYRLIGASRGI